ncbi:hypothetical protein LC040_12460 [Bacillus tianshenii]|nr:hypothetical protein LC040_12460 [Bacillus tianshenii]
MANVLTTEERFQEGTLVGPINISGMTVNEAREHVLTEVDTWKQETDYVMSYLDKKIQVDDQIYIVDLKETVNMSHDGKVSPVTFNLNGEIFEKFILQLMPDELLGEVNEELLQEVMLARANSFQTGEEVFQLENFLKERELYEREFVTMQTASLDAEVAPASAALGREIRNRDGKCEQFIFSARNSRIRERYYRR